MLDSLKVLLVSLSSTFVHGIAVGPIIRSTGFQLLE